jgi:hypothetical protein
VVQSGAPFIGVPAAVKGEKEQMFLGQYRQKKPDGIDFSGI